MRLLIAVDSIITLDILLNEIAARSWPSGTEAHILSIVEDADVPAETWREEGYGVAAMRDETRRRGEQITAMAVARLEAIGLSSKITMMRGNPGFLIPFAAGKWSSDLILIRAHNRSGSHNWMLGSVAKVIVERATCSVEVVRPAAAGDSLVTQRGTRILLATDGSDASGVAAQAVAETAWPAGTEVKVVSVVNPMMHWLGELGLFHHTGTDRAHRAVGAAINELRGTLLKLSEEVVVGRVARKVIDRARKWSSDLIVLGTHERQGLRKLLFGSTAAAVTEQAHCSVRTIRGRSDDVKEGRLRDRTDESVHNVGPNYRLEANGVWRRAA
jgi:nucleotide-binding universal stress UspA family protein